MYNDYRTHGFVAIAINIEEDMETVVKPYARQNTNPYLRDDGSAWAAYAHTGGIPLNYVIDTAGVVRYWEEGFTESAVRQTILQYLPDPIEHDVGVARIIAPDANVDSIATVVPACSVYNYASNTETYPVRMQIGTEYDTTVTVTGHTPGTRRYVQFPAWHPGERGSLAVRCSTELAGDDITDNDLATGTVTVNVNDVALVAVLAPSDTVDSGSSVTPAVVVVNRGMSSDMARIRLTIGTGYRDSISVPLIAGKTDTAYLRAWTASPTGVVAISCTSGTFHPDMVPANNLLTGSVYVRASGIAEPPSSPVGFALFGAEPNPAGSAAVLRYALPAQGPVDLRVYSSSGKLVRTLVAGFEPAGRHQATWDGRDDAGQHVSRGVYYCRLTSGTFEATRKLTRID